MTDKLNTPDSKPAPPAESARLTTGFIFDIKKYAIHDGPGIRTTVFFKGCPLQCQWCQNPESWKQEPELGLRTGRCVRCGQCVKVCTHGAITLTNDQLFTDVSKCDLCGECVDACTAGAREIIGRKISVGEVMSEIEKDVVFYEQSSGGVTFSGGEPLMQPEFLLTLLNHCKAQGIHTAVDTCCYAKTDLLERISEKTDLFLCDIKHMNNDMHKRFTGVENNLILDNIRRLSEIGKEIIIRIPVIVGFNDDKENIEATAKYVSSLSNIIRVDVLPYNRGGMDKSARLSSDLKLMQVETPDDKKINSFVQILKKSGFEVKTGG